MPATPGFPEYMGLGDRLKRLEAQVDKLNRMTRLESASIGAGGLRVKDDGSIQFLATDGTVILEIDKDAFTYSRADGTRILEITPAGTAKVYAPNGTTEQLVLNGTGLFIEGVQQPELDISTANSSSNSAGTYTSTFQVFNTVNISVPTWAQNAHLIILTRAQLTTGGTGRHLQMETTIDDANAPASGSTQTVPSNTVGQVGRHGAFTLSSFGSTIVVRQWVSIDAGTESSHNENLSVLAWFTR